MRGSAARMTARRPSTTSIPISNTLVTVLVIASVRLYREGISGSLVARGGVEILGSAATGDEARSLMASRQPDVIVIDAAAHRSFDIVQRLRAQAPSVSIVVFGVEDAESDILACAEAGVNGYVLCDASIDDLYQVIARAVRGELLCSPQITASLFRRLGALAGSRDLLPGRWIDLTGREREVLALLDAGLSNKQIANELHIEISTVKNHVHRVLEKLHVDSRSAAVASLRGGLSKRQPALRPSDSLLTR
jgi:two-component system nitrate/nitrite response regulator NarL